MQNRLIFIVALPRSATTTLSRKLCELKDSRVTTLRDYELYTHHILSSGDVGINILNSLRIRNDCIIPWTKKHLEENKFLLNKLFPYQMQYEAMGLTKVKILHEAIGIHKFIFLKRNINDVYNSHKRALNTCNWGYTPEEQKENIALGKVYPQNNKHLHVEQSMRSLLHYQEMAANWFEDMYAFANDKLINYMTLSFNEVVDKAFDASICFKDI